MIHSTTFSFDESSVWDPKVIREHLCIPEEQLNILSNIPGWSKVADDPNPSRIDKDTTTQNSQSSQFNISVTTQNCQKDSLVPTQNYQSGLPVATQNCQQGSLVPARNCQQDSLVPAQNCQKGFAVTTHNSQQVSSNIELFDKYLQLHGSALKTFKEYKKKFAKSVSMCELDKIGENLPNNELLKKTLSLPELNHSFDNLYVKSLHQNSDCEIASPEQFSSYSKVLPTHKPVKQPEILDPKDTVVTKSASPSKTSLEVMEVVSQLPVNISSHIEKVANELVVPVVEKLDMLPVVHTTENSDNLSGGQSAAVDNGIVPVNNNSITCDNGHRNKPNSESNENKLDSCIKETIPPSVGPSIDSEKGKTICNSIVKLAESPALIIELPKPLVNEQISAEKLIFNNQENAKLQDFQPKMPNEQKVSNQEICVEAIKPGAEDKCAQGKRKSEFKMKSSKKRKSNRDAKSDDGEKRPNEARNIKRASEICFTVEDTINMINILKNFL